MTTIADLSEASSVSGNDLIPLYSVSAGGTRKIPLSAIVGLVEDEANQAVAQMQGQIDALNIGASTASEALGIVAANANKAAVTLDGFDSVLTVVPSAERAAIRAGTSTYDASAVIQEALDAGKRLILPPGSAINAQNLRSVANGALVCIAGRATIRVGVGVGYYGIRIMTSNFTLDGINFDGGNMGPYKVASAVGGTRAGVVVGNPYGTGTQLQGVSVRNCDVYGFDDVGVRGRETVIGFSFGKRAAFENVNCHHNYTNWLFEQRFEYSTMTNCYGYEGFLGMGMTGGNNTVVACHFEENFYNCQLVAGENHAHGQFIGCSFNHAATDGYGLVAVNITAGHVFTGCAFWYSPIKLDNCAGVFIRAGQISSSNITIVAGGLNGIDDNHTPTGLTVTQTGIHYTSFRRNRVSANDTAKGPVYGDLAIRSTASTFAYPLGWNATTSTELPLVFDLKKWHGADASYLDASGRANIMRTGWHTIDAKLGFNTLAAAEMVTVKLVRYTGTTRLEEYADCRAFPATLTGCSVAVNTRMLCNSGDTIALEVKTLTTTGITIPAGGVFLQVNSID